MESKVLKIPTKNIIRSILEVLNPFLGYLTPQELSLLDIMITNKWTTITSDVRAAIRTKSDLEKYTFNNYIKKLKDKGAILTKENTMYVNPTIVEMTKNPNLNIKFYEQQ